MDERFYEYYSLQGSVLKIQKELYPPPIGQERIYEEREGLNWLFGAGKWHNVAHLQLPVKLTACSLTPPDSEF